MSRRGVEGVTFYVVGNGCDIERVLPKRWRAEDLVPHRESLHRSGIVIGITAQIIPIQKEQCTFFSSADGQALHRTGRLID